MNKKNLLFIFTDEQRFDTMAVYGNHKIAVPNLNRLCEESIVFEKAYVTQPVCTPSRSTIVTGLYPHTNGCTHNNIPLKEQTKSLLECDDFSEYRTAYIGKWHLGDEIFPQHGFDEWISVEDLYRNFYNYNRDLNAHSTYHHWLKQHDQVEDGQAVDGWKFFSRNKSCSMPEDLCKPEFLAQETVSCLNEFKDEPFVMFVNFLEPHMPFFGPRDDQYDPDEIDLPENFNEAPDGNIPLRNQTRLLRQLKQYKQFMGTDAPSETDWRKLIARYWGLVSQVDTAIGKILDQLESLGLIDDTVIVFTSDHGDMMGSHSMIAKEVQYEEAVRVPLMIRIPGHNKNGSMVPEPVSQIDLVPTILDYLGKNTPGELQGYSWRNFLDHDQELEEQNVFIEWNPEKPQQSRMDCSIRTVITPDGWKFNWGYFGENELYNLNDDPCERHNLVDCAEYATLIKKLKETIREWQIRTGDNITLCP